MIRERKRWEGMENTTEREDSVTTKSKVCLSGARTTTCICRDRLKSPRQKQAGDPALRPLIILTRLLDAHSLRPAQVTRLAQTQQHRKHPSENTSFKLPDHAE